MPDLAASGGHRRRWIVAVVLTVALAAVVTGLVIRHSNKDRLAAGATRSGGYSISDGEVDTSADLVVPNAQIDVRVEIGQRGQQEDSDDGSDGTIRAPKGGLLVDLSWTSTGAPRRTQGKQPTRLSIRSAGRTVVVDADLRPKPASSDDDGGPEKVVALPGRPSDVELVAEFAGRTQTVRLIGGRRTMGSFASLYPPAGSGSLSALPIDQHQPKDPDSPFSWSGRADRGTVLRTPYVSGLGWAPAGREWVVVLGAGYDIDTHDPVTWSAGKGYAEYSTSGTPRAVTTVNGHAPRKTLGAEQVRTVSNRRYVSRDYVFSVVRGAGFTVDTVVRATTRRTGGDAHAPKTATMVLSTSSAYPPAVDPTVGGAR
ncbi:hypothetical protein [Flexivirga oryzae]|uniref:Uncharacterized protein n=1 Tax=Flexivirga oryzae TaxID=1794944 RepID=A0A839NAG2_9MICO|nr:hypothetical protein [Flexivirga oryzae]MBB2892626.1 hypothetical protein [Flexivirga oryzae]MBB2894519.1 hypothetical protein [Flexivirga oryzae]